MRNIKCLWTQYHTINLRIKQIKNQQPMGGYQDGTTCVSGYQPWSPIGLQPCAKVIFGKWALPPPKPLPSCATRSHSMAIFALPLHPCGLGLNLTWMFPCKSSEFSVKIGGLNRGALFSVMSPCFVYVKLGILESSVQMVLVGSVVPLPPREGMLPLVLLSPSPCGCPLFCWVIFSVRGSCPPSLGVLLLSKAYRSRQKNKLGISFTIHG